jgi:hypothetical protein
LVYERAYAWVINVSSIPDSSVWVRKRGLPSYFAG